MARYIKAVECADIISERFNISLDDLVDVFAEIPTADVAPKSEEGAECPTCYGTGRIGTTNWLTKNMTKKQIAEEKAQAIAEHEQYIKTEYAREIFEEIEKLLECGFSSCHINGTEEQFDFYRADLGFQIAELKKKYTEDE